MKTGPYEIMPIQVALNGIPLVADDETLGNSNKIGIRDVTTLPTSLDDAHSRTQDQLKAVRHRLKLGDHQALVDLLDDHPEFSTHPWVLNELLKWRCTGRSYRKPGRKKGSFVFHPLVIVGVVKELKKRGWAKTNESAFEWLYDHWAIGYETARYQYYRTSKQARFKAVLMQGPIGGGVRTPEQIEETIDRAELLETGKTIVRTVETPDGPLTMTFRGL